MRLDHLDKPADPIFGELYDMNTNWTTGTSGMLYISHALHYFPTLQKFKQIPTRINIFLKVEIVFWTCKHIPHL